MATKKMCGHKSGGKNRPWVALYPPGAPLPVAHLYTNVYKIPPSLMYDFSFFFSLALVRSFDTLSDAPLGRHIFMRALV